MRRWLFVPVSNWRFAPPQKHTKFANSEFRRCGYFVGIRRGFWNRSRESSLVGISRCGREKFNGITDSQYALEIVERAITNDCADSSVVKTLIQKGTQTPSDLLRLLKRAHHMVSSPGVSLATATKSSHARTYVRFNQ